MTIMTLTGNDLLALLGGAATLASGMWALITLAGRQFEKRLDERFAMQEKARNEGRRASEDRMQKLEARYEALDQDVRKIMIELPREYVARADYVRRETVIEAKIDRVGLQIENLLLKTREQK